MKKVLLVCAMGTFLFSCGKSACDCKTESEELVKEMFSSMGDETKLKELQADAEDLKEDCKEYSLADYKDCK
jgi:hypothetical protein